jgi:hypothetical protein
MACVETWTRARIIDWRREAPGTFLRTNGVMSQSTSECSHPAHGVGPASLPAKTTGTEADATHVVNESPASDGAEKMREPIRATLYYVSV